jgi:hypothetical protein
LLDLLAREQPVLASCYAASTADRQLLGDAPGQQTRKLAHAVREVAKRNDALAEVGGVNVHAGAAVPSRDRQRLERLCRHVARPPIAQDRLELTADSRCRYNFRHAWKNGVHAVVLDPLDLIARLCALIPHRAFTCCGITGCSRPTPMRGLRSCQGRDGRAVPRAHRAGQVRGNRAGNDELGVLFATQPLRRARPNAPTGVAR